MYYVRKPATQADKGDTCPVTALIVIYRLKIAL